MKEVVIVSAVRTPIGSFLGSLSKVPAPELGAVAIKGALDKINLDPKEVNEVLMGHVVQAGVGQAPARQAALKAGIHENVPCTTVNKVCSSGMKSIMQAAQSIAIGDNDVVIAGGMENMSLIPHYFNARVATKFGSKEVIDGLQLDGLIDVYNKQAMGCLADLCASKYNLSKQDQDDFAVESYSRSKNAWENGKFKNEIIPVEIKDRRGNITIVDEDEEYKNFNEDKLRSLRPVFTKDGTVTAGNASTINDGASALILMSLEKCKSLNLNPIAKILAYSDVAQDPKWFTTSPAKAVPKVLEKAKLKINDIDLFELNEAFSVVGLANIKILNIDKNKVNVNGGAVSLGHPLGCSGARIVTTLINTLIQNDKKTGLAAICNGGGGASSIIIQLN
ncbi:thiolase family protein [Flavobacteriaceae bacterium]|jgi:acetyl-CoA C-acetyltransferase|nr:thiolase family protein [Flavobacteriaceae bacterium]